MTLGWLRISKSGIVCLFSNHSPALFFALTGTTPHTLPFGSPSQPAKLQVPGTGVPTMVPNFKSEKALA